MVLPPKPAQKRRRTPRRSRGARISRGRGASGGPAWTAGRTRSGGAEAKRPRSEAESAAIRTRSGAATRGGATGERATRPPAALQCASIPTMPGGLPHGEASERAGARERRRSRNGGDGSDHAPRGNERRAQLRYGCRASAPRASGATKRSRHHRGGVEGLRHSTPPWCSLIIDHVFGQIA